MRSHRFYKHQHSEREPFAGEDVLDVLRLDRKQLDAHVKKAQKRLNAEIRKRLNALIRGERPAAKKPVKAKLNKRKTLKPLLASQNLRPTNFIELRLPSGLRQRLRVKPQLAAFSELKRLNEATTHNHRRLHANQQDQHRHLTTLDSGHQGLVKRVEKLEQGLDPRLLKLLSKGLFNLEQQVKLADKKVEQALKSQGRQLKQQQGALKTQGELAIYQQLHGALASLQSAAFGSRGKLLNTNNILLLISQLGFTFAPQLLKLSGLRSAIAPNLELWLTPIASALGSQVLLGRRTQERFISDTTALSAGTLGQWIKVDLKPYVAASFWADFRKRTDLPVTASVLAQAPAISKVLPSVTGFVHDGQLYLRIGSAGHTTSASALANALTVAWTVDTGGKYV